MRFRLRAAAILAASAMAALPAAAADQPTIAFTRIAEKLPFDTPYLTLQEVTMFVGCRPTGDTLKGDGQLKALDVKAWEPLFQSAFKRPEYLNANIGQNLFGGESRTADFEIGALISGMDVTLCQLTMLDPTSTEKDPSDNKMKVLGANGSARLAIEWQIFDAARRQVVATITTNSLFEIKDRKNVDILEPLLNGAFVEGVKQFAADPLLTEILAADRATQENRAAIELSTAPPRPRPIAEVNGAVLLVQTSGGHGSGFLVSSDGYVLTNAHVVGTEKTVRLRWSDGLETSGEVVRVHSGRDVALIKTDPRGREPLPLGPRQPGIGDAVLAVGAPLDVELQGSVTRGIVSANRILDGYSFIQSDVAVNPGNSGGPLVADSGEVVGVTVSGRVIEGVPVGVNFFIPIKDALDFLSLRLAQQ